MLRLTTFGGIAISRAGSPVPGATEGWRRRALFALVASSPGGVARDSLLAMLWPDSDADSGRHSLDQLLYTMRRSLGANPFRGTDMIQLDPTTVSCDVPEFDDAVRHGDFERAIALSAGRFADGLDTNSSDEVGRRIDGVRQRLTADRAISLESVARSAAARNDVASAIRNWRQLAESDPLNSRVASAYIGALVAGGERARALQFALVHEALLASELSTKPEAEIADWIRRLRADPASAPTPSRLSTSASEDVVAGTDNRSSRLTRLLGQHYRLGALLADGSVSADFEVRATGDASVPRVLRLIQPRLAMLTTVNRFRAVMESVMSLTHPGLQGVFDVGASEDLFFVVTAPRANSGLRDRLRAEGALPVSDAIRIARELASGLSLAHSHGRRHADLRPKHVDLANGSAILTGLGIAEALTTASLDDATSTVVTIGSPAYLSPEQLLRRSPADARADVYALGCILYEMLVGEPPFGRTLDGDAIARKVAGEHVQLRIRRASASEPLGTVVDRCLAPVPADRFASATELTEALGDLA